MRKYYNDDSRVSSSKKAKGNVYKVRQSLYTLQSEPLSRVGQRCRVQSSWHERQTSGQTGSQFPNIARNARAAAPLRMSPRFTNSGIFRFPYPYKADELIVWLFPRSGQRKTVGLNTDVRSLVVSREIGL